LLLLCVIGKYGGGLGLVFFLVLDGLLVHG
jgi:hypothetical protein